MSWKRGREKGGEGAGRNFQGEGADRALGVAVVGGVYRDDTPLKCASEICAVHVPQSDFSKGVKA